MSNFCKRIGKRLKYTWNSFRSDCYFSPYYAFLGLSDELGGRLGAKRLADHAHTRKNKWIFEYLVNVLQPVLDEMKNMKQKGEHIEKAPIWVCWWTGEESAPSLVKRCIRSIRENSGQHPVNLITEKNYKNYLVIPEYMLEKVQMKKMGLAHLSDYIRVALLEQYGGLWLDATIYCSQQIPDEYFRLPVFTCKSPRQPCGYISEYQWTTFILGGWKGNVFYHYLKSAFEIYWKETDTAIDYLFFDYLIKLADDTIPAISEYLKAVPCNNLHRDDLQAAMNAALPADQFVNVIKDDTCLYKLSWREYYSERTETGEKSIYLQFIDS